MTRRIVPAGRTRDDLKGRAAPRRSPFLGIETAGEDVRERFYFRGRRHRTRVAESVTELRAENSQQPFVAGWREGKPGRAERVVGHVHRTSHLIVLADAGYARPSPR